MSPDENLSPEPEPPNGTEAAFVNDVRLHTAPQRNTPKTISTIAPRRDTRSPTWWPRVPEIKHLCGAFLWADAQPTLEGDPRIPAGHTKLDKEDVN